MPIHCRGVTVSDKITLAETMTICEVKIFAIPPRTKGAPAAKSNGGRTAPNKETPIAAVNQSSSNGSTVGLVKGAKVTDIAYKYGYQSIEGFSIALNNNLINLIIPIK